MRFPSVAWLGPAPAHANDAFAGLHALGEGLGCRGHGTVASEVGVILGAEAFDDVGACGLVGCVAQDEWVAVGHWPWGLKETVTGGWAPEGAGEGKRGGSLSDPRLLGRQPAKAPIWETAAFFSTAASVGAS